MSEPGTPTAELLLKGAERNASKDFALFDGGERWTYDEALHRAWSIAGSLRSLGLAPGEPILSWLPNGPEGLALMLGTNAAGCVYAPLNVDFRGTLLEHAINLPQARIIVLHAELLGRLDGLSLPHLEFIVVVGGEAAPPLGRRTISWGELAAAEPVAPDSGSRRQPEDDMAYIYTSGTTGPSKAVRCSYQLHGAYADWFRLGDLGAEDRAMLPLPMFHVAGTGWIYTMLAWGGSIAIVPRFSTDRYWDSLRELGATTGTVMAAMATFLLRRPEQPDDRDNPMRIALLVPGFPGALGFGERFGVELWSGYAMTEVPGPLRTALGTRNLQSAGQATSPEWDVSLVDESGDPVADGEVGELLVRHREPAAITGGYVNMPEATAEAWKGGWFHTGDLLRRDEHGEHYFVDRNKDALRRRGENVSSFEVEAEIVAHPDVLEATVVGAPSAEAEDEVLAFVVLQPGRTLAERDLFEFLVPRMPHYMVPRFITFVDEFPRTPTQKVRKVELRERGTEGSWDALAEGMALKSTRIGEG